MHPELFENIDQVTPVGTFGHTLVHLPATNEYILTQTFEPGEELRESLERSGIPLESAVVSSETFPDAWSGMVRMNQMVVGRVILEHASAL